MKAQASIAALVLGTVLETGCTTTGIGFGSTPSSHNAVTFSWKSADDVSGSMTASLASGTIYTGQFFQITRNMTVATLDPLWAGGGPRWNMGGRGDWQWNRGPDFVTRYSGRVVANLATADGAHMRCRFQLVHPSDGMAGGGQGECQMPDGQRIDAQFPKA
jgi:hypothetical protein